MGEEEISLQELWQTILKRGWLIVGLTVVAMIVAFIVSCVVTPIYEAETTLMIKGKSSDFDLSLSEIPLIGVGMPGISNTAQNYVQLLQSRTILMRALGKLGLEPGVGVPRIEKLKKVINTKSVMKTDVLQLKVQLPDKTMACDLANALVDVLIEYDMDMNRSASRTAAEYLMEQVELSDLELRRAEERVLAVKAGKRIVELTAEAEEQIKKLLALETLRAEEQMALGQSQAQLKEIRQQIQGMSETVLSQETIVEDPVVAQYRGRLADLEMKLAVAGEKYTDLHPEVQRLAAEIAEAKGALGSAVARVVGAQVETPNPIRQALLAQVIEAESQMAAAQAKIDALDKLIAIDEARLEKLPERELDLARVIREFEMAQRVYVMLRTKYEEVRLSEQMQAPEIRLIDAAIVPEKPSKPRKVLNTAIAGVLGLFVGVGAAFVLELADTSMKSAEEVEAALGVPVLGAIPVHPGCRVEQVAVSHPSQSSRNSRTMKRT
ncbi:MAG: GNVR domain-containing protein [Clostridia bacterium]|nr:GNVR domain-containing protein [Clostridia bacterium]